MKVILRFNLPVQQIGEIEVPETSRIMAICDGELHVLADPKVQTEPRLVLLAKAGEPVPDHVSYHVDTKKINGIWYHLFSSSPYDL